MADDARTEWRSDVVDVSGMTLTELVELTEGDASALAHSLRRLAADLARSGETIAGFNSAL